MVVNEPTAIARLSIDVIKLAVLRWVVWRVRALSVLLRRPPLRRITKPTGRTFDLQNHRVRSAVRQALKNVAYASSARPRGSAGPIRAEPLYCQFDLPVRRRPIGSCEVFFVLCHLVPENLNIRRASRARKLVLPTAGGPESQRSVGATDIQRFHTIGVFRWS
jgi:hypothetical protein